MTAIAAPEEPDDGRTRRITRADRLRRRGLPVPDDEALEEFRRRVSRRPHPVAAWMNMSPLVVGSAPPVEDEPASPVTALAIYAPVRRQGWLARVVAWAYFGLRLDRIGQPLDPKPFALFTAWTLVVWLVMQLLFGGHA